MAVVAKPLDSPMAAYTLLGRAMDVQQQHQALRLAILGIMGIVVSYARILLLTSQ